MTVEVSSTLEIDKREREVQIILNIIQPDPEGQPLIIHDNICISELTWESPIEVEERLRFYFNNNLPAPLDTPLWQFIDIVKSQILGWPDN